MGQGKGRNTGIVLTFGVPQTWSLGDQRGLWAQTEGFGKHVVRGREPSLVVREGRWGAVRLQKGALPSAACSRAQGRWRDLRRRWPLGEAWPRRPWPASQNALGTVWHRIGHWVTCLELGTPCWRTGTENREGDLQGWHNEPRQSWGWDAPWHFASPRKRNTPQRKGGKNHKVTELRFLLPHWRTRWRNLVIVEEEYNGEAPRLWSPTAWVQILASCVILGKPLHFISLCFKLKKFFFNL